MRAALLIGYGGPNQLVVSDEVPVPVPGQDEVLIRVAACGVNNTDINTRVGWYSASVAAATADGGFGVDDPVAAAWGSAAMQFPRIQGADICGTVVVGPDHLVGCRVIVDPILRDPSDPDNRAQVGYLGSERDGGFAEYVCVPLSNLHPVRSELSDVELAAIACSGGAAEHMLARAGVNAGETVVVTGASGGVGTFLVQLARRRGARVIAVASAEKADVVRAIGADAVVPREAPDLIAEVRAAAAGPIDVVADVVGGAAAFAGWLELLRVGGRYTTAGAIAGPMVQLDLRTLYLKDLSLFGATVFPSSLFADLVGYIERGEVQPVVAATFALGQIHEAQAAFARKAHTGSIVITL